MALRKLVIFLFPTLAVGLPNLACHDDDHDHATPSATSCAAIIEACHSKDTGSGPIHECHEFAESKGETECAAKKTECLTTCGGQGAADAGPG